MRKVRIAYLTTGGADVIPLVSAVRALTEEKGEIAEVLLRTGEDLAEPGELENFIRFARESHLLIMHLMGGKKSFPHFDKLISSLEGGSVRIHAQGWGGEPDVELIRLSTVSEEDRRKISRYINYGGVENFKNLLLFAANRFAGAEFEIREPERPPWEGIYHPDLDRIPTLEEYLERKLVPGRPTVGLMFYQSFWQSKNTAFVDKLIVEIERCGANVIPVFLYSVRDVELGTKGTRWVIENYFMRDGKPLIDVLISTLMFSLSMWMSEFSLKELGVPVIKAILTLNTPEEWRESIQGLNPVDVTMSVAMPEFDGMLITVPVAARKQVEIDPLTGARIIKYEPLPERVEKVVRLALNWAKLRHIPNEEKRVAIIIHNYPPRNDQIGTALGLDAPASVRNILRKLGEAGFKLDRLPESGQELIEELIAGLTNDRRWASAEEMAKRAAGRVSREQYMTWIRELPEEVQSKMVQAWGEPPRRLFNCGG